MDLINGYPAAKVRQVLLDRMAEFTSRRINERLARFEAGLASLTEPIVLSLGENCAASTQLRAARIKGTTASFFDFLVAPVDSVIRLLQADFADALSLRNLVIGNWEDQDSVLDTKYNVFFHHQFYLRDCEKDDWCKGYRRRRIEEVDIPLFLPSVKSQYEYLAEKLRRVLRAPNRKVVVLRLVHGEGHTALDLSQAA